MKKDDKDTGKEPKDSDKQSQDSDKESKVSNKESKDSDKEQKDSDKKPKDSDKSPKDSDKSPKDSDKNSKHSDTSTNDSKREPNVSTKGSNSPVKEHDKSEKRGHESENGPSQIKKESKSSIKPTNANVKPSEKESKDSEDFHKKPNVQEALDVALSHVGEMGRFQRIMFALMFPFGLIFAFLFFVQLFITLTPQKHWCTVPELSHLDMTLRRNLSAPGAATGKWDNCATFDVNWTQVLMTMTAPPLGTPTVPCQHGWEFDLTDIPYHTVVTERGWVCENADNVPLAQAMFFVGAIFGGLSLGWLADYFGRVPALMCANLIGSIGGIMTTFSTGMWDFTMCRFIVGIAFDNIFMMPYILVLEFVGPSYRTWVANLSIVFFGVGCLMLPGLALLFKDWRLLVWTTSLPMLLVVFAPLGFPESARWYVSRGRVSDAVEILRKFERVNKVQIPDEAMKDFIVAANETKETDESLLVLLTNARLRMTMIFMLVVYMACAVIFDVLVRMSDAFGLDFFITYTLTSATEIPSVLLLASLLDIWGRRYLTAGPIALCAVFILVAMFVPLGIPQATMAVMARFCINMAYNAVVLWTTELLPTAVRASGSATMHMSGYVVSILSPYIVYSERLWHELPLLILFSVAVVSSGCSMVLPETKGRPMPQTIADGERLVKEQPLWRFRKSDRVEWKKDKEKALIIS